MLVFDPRGGRASRPEIAQRDLAAQARRLEQGRQHVGAAGGAGPRPGKGSMTSWAPELYGPAAPGAMPSRCVSALARSAAAPRKRP